ncbi:MAG: hypothetical protein AAGD10_06800 [Myxococcota bacterium]
MRVLLALFLLGTTACDETLLGRTQDPSPVVDMGMGFPSLPLQVGESFVYDARLTRRPGPNVDDVNSRYRIRITITDVLDAGEDGISEVSYRAERLDDPNDPNDLLADPDWVPQFDADSWVGQLGPSQTSDAVAGQPTTLLLEGAPSMPSGPKQIPAATTFFVDLRFPVELQEDWRATQNGDFSAVDALFSRSGADTSIRFHETNQTRSLTIQYDERGVLCRMNETIGDTTQTPNSNMFLDVEGGCP